MRSIERAMWMVICAALAVCALRAIGKAWSADRRADAAQRLVASALGAEGFYRAKLVSQRRLLREFNKGLKPLADKLDAAGLHIAAHERATARLETRTSGTGEAQQSASEPPDKGVQPPATDCVPVPWTDNRLTLEDYEPQTDALTYSLHQRFRIAGTYLSDERGAIRFGRLELYELDERGDVIGTAEITDYELLAAKTKRRWRPRIGILAGAELDFKGSLMGLSTGVEVAFNRLSLFGLANIKSEPTVVVGAGWRW